MNNQNTKNSPAAKRLKRCNLAENEEVLRLSTRLSNSYVSRRNPSSVKSIEKRFSADSSKSIRNSQIENDHVPNKRRIHELNNHIRQTNAYSANSTKYVSKIVRCNKSAPSDVVLLRNILVMLGKFDQKDLPELIQVLAHDQARQVGYYHGFPISTIANLIKDVEYSILGARRHLQRAFTTNKVAFKSLEENVENMKKLKTLMKNRPQTYHTNNPSPELHLPNQLTGAQFQKLIFSEYQDKTANSRPIRTNSPVASTSSGTSAETINTDELSDENLQSE